MIKMTFLLRLQWSQLQATLGDRLVVKPHCKPEFGHFQRYLIKEGRHTLNLVDTTSRAGVPE